MADRGSRRLGRGLVTMTPQRQLGNERGRAEAAEAEVERLREALERARAVPDNEYEEAGGLTYVTPRDPQVVLAEIRSALTPQQDTDDGG
jgi:hypothetical protein